MQVFETHAHERISRFRSLQRHPLIHLILGGGSTPNLFLGTVVFSGVGGGAPFRFSFFHRATTSPRDLGIK